MKSSFPISPAAPLHNFSVVAGELQIGGIGITRLAARVGQTPFYAYDRQLINRRVAELRAQLPSPLRIHYAIKANPLPALVCHLASQVDGLDIASAGELKLALDTGIEPAQISFAGPGKTVPDLEQAVASGVCINIESTREAERIAEISQRTGWPAQVALRINPDFELKSAGMKMSGGPKPFGIDAEQAPEVLKQIKRLDLAFDGFHIYAGSQNLRAEAIAEAQWKSWELILRLSEFAPSPVRSVNLGGGFGIPYFPGEKALDLSPIADALQKIIDNAALQLPGAQFVLELGRYLVGEAGIYVTKVIDKKVSRGQTFLVTDGGMNHHLAASGNLGQVIRKNYPVLIGNSIGNPLAAPATIVGPLCTPLDILADKVALPEAIPGDLVVVFQSGAYGASASPQSFLNQHELVEVLL